MKPFETLMSHPDVLSSPLPRQRDSGDAPVKLMCKRESSAAAVDPREQAKGLKTNNSNRCMADSLNHYPLMASKSPFRSGAGEPGPSIDAAIFPVTLAAVAMCGAASQAIRSDTGSAKATRARRDASAK
jgi:hypothetical protein